MNEERRKRLEELKNRNLARQKELEKAKEQAAASEVSKKIEEENKSNDVNELASMMRKSNADMTKDIKMASTLLQEKLGMTKREFHLEIQEDYKTEYLATIKETANSEAQCEILEKPNFESLKQEKQEEKEKGKKPKSRAIQKLVSQLLKGSFMKSVIQKHNFGEIMAQNEKKAQELFNDPERSVELIEFMSDERVELFETALSNLQIYDSFKSYYDETGSGDMDFKRTWISNQTELLDETLVHMRSVRNIEFPAHFHENVLGMYTPEFGNLDSSEPNGLMILHNIQKKKSELVMKYQTEFTSCCFHKGNPKLVIAGTYTGQILVYDIRAGPAPILKTPSSGKYHSLPIYCIDNYGMDNSNQIVACSNDGLVCVFNISNFSKALKKVEIKKSVENKYSQQVTMEDIGVICSAIRPDSETLYVGSDDCDLYEIFLGQK